MVSMEQGLKGLTTEYFDYVATCFPVMCASDEFHFVPRAEAARRYYHRMEDISGDAMAECVNGLKDFKKRFSRLLDDGVGLEDCIDLETLRANVSGILIEMEKKASWRHNPLLYLKIAFIGLDHAVTKPAENDTERLDRIRSRLNAMPRLLAQGEKNLTEIPEAHRGAAVAMIRDSVGYVSRIGKWLLAGQMAVELEKELENLIGSLRAFESVVHSLPPMGEGRFQVTSILNTTLRDHFLSRRDLGEIFQIGVDEWRRCLERLEELQRRIDPDKTWQALYHGYAPEGEKLDTISLYEREARRLAHFFEGKLIDALHRLQRLEVVSTPDYLRSVRGSASFGAAFGEDEKDVFYITTGDVDGLRKRLHREYRFLTAHETVPGHQLLDSVRRSLSNPIRRQIESPLFYEGWACYAESLLVEYGYVSNSMEELVDMKRRLWRAARCQVDVGLNTGQLAQEDAIGLISAAGFSEEEARRQVDRFKLNPGYQLCYTLGRHEIMELRKRYGSDMGRGRFHKCLLEGGEVAFHLVEERFKTLMASLRS